MTSTWKLFPLVAGGKYPALEGDWRGHATSDEATIAEWERAGYNLALHLEDAGLCVIDIDGPDGDAAWDLLLKEHGCPPSTYEVKSPRGRHIYFRGKLRPSVSKIGNHIDTRGLGSYVGIPGNTTEAGTYKVLLDLPIADLPPWIPDALERASPRHQDKAAVAELDLPVNVGRATNYLKQHKPLVMGAGADGALYEVACELREYGISPEKSVDLITTHLAVSPWEVGRTDAWILRKVANAEAYAQNEAGAWGVGSLERFAGVLDQLPDLPPKGADKPAAARSPILWPVDQDKLKPPIWKLRGVFAQRGLCVTHGHEKHGKTFVVLDQCFTLASTAGGWGLEPGHEPETVIYCTREGIEGIARRRRPAWEVAREAKAERFGLLPWMPFADDEESIAQFLDIVEPHKPSLIVLDHWATFLGGFNENDATESNRAANIAIDIKNYLHCAVHIVAHDSKSGGLRGSNALAAAADHMHVVERPSLDLPFTSLRNEWHKDADRRPEPWFFQFKEVFTEASIVQAVSEQTFKAGITLPDALAPKHIGQALQKLNAYGLEAAVTTYILAQALYEGSLTESEDDRQAALSKLERQLRSRSKHLDAYCEKRSSGELAWFLPAKIQE